VAQAFEKLGVEYCPAERSKSDPYLDFLPLVNAGRAELLEVSRLATQLLGLERRTSPQRPRQHRPCARGA
jgi:hypothetical protein